MLEMAVVGLYAEQVMVYSPQQEKEIVATVPLPLKLICEGQAVVGLVMVQL